MSEATLQGLLEQIVSEPEAHQIYKSILGDKELRYARQSGQLGYIRRNKKIYYFKEELDNYIQAALEKGYIPPCPKTNLVKIASKSESSGWAPSLAREISTASGTLEIVRRSANVLLGQQIAKKPS